MMGMFFPDFFGVESYEKYARGANVGGFLATNLLPVFVPELRSGFPPRAASTGR
jgi:hypothetical protein